MSPELKAAIAEYTGAFTAHVMARALSPGLPSLWLGWRPSSGPEGVIVEVEYRDGFTRRVVQHEIALWTVPSYVAPAVVGRAAAEDCLRKLLG